MDPPSFAAPAALRMIVPRPHVIDFESIHFTGKVSASASAANCAACPVAERAKDKLIQITPSAPASAHLLNAASNAPGEGAAVDGKRSLSAIFW